MIEPVAMSKGWGERTVADLASLVVELGRLYKGLTFYAADHPARRELVDRAFLAWRVNLERAGPLELYLDPAEIRCVGLDESIGSAHQQDLLNALSSRGIRQLRFDPELDRKCFLCFAELLTDEGDAAAAAGFARTLYAAGGAGILVNGETPPQPDPFPELVPADPAPQRAPAAALSPAEPPPAAPSNAGASAGSSAAVTTPVAPAPPEPRTQQPPTSEPPTAPLQPEPAPDAATLAGPPPAAAEPPMAVPHARAASDAAEPSAAPRPNASNPVLPPPPPAQPSADESPAEWSPAQSASTTQSAASSPVPKAATATPHRAEQPGSPVASLGSALLGGIDSPTAAPGGHAGRPEGLQALTSAAVEGGSAASPQPVWPAQPPGGVCSIEEDPFEAPAADMKGERLRLSLRELDRSSDDAIYEIIAHRIGSWTAEVGEATRLDESFRVMLVLADHAAGLGGRSGSQVRVAQTTLEELACKPLMVDLIDRSCSRERSKGVRPAQVLLQLGERAVPLLLERLEDESDPRRSAEISALVLAMGEHAVPALARSLSRPTSHGRVQLAVRLAGELQSPKLIPILASVLMDGGPALRKEAAKALVHIGNSEATNVLIKALSSPLEELPRTAALCLGVLGDARAVEPLLKALERAASGRQPQLAEGIIRALGPFKASADLVVPRLVAVLGQRSLVRRRQLRGPKLAALMALEGFDESEARQAIIAATDDRDSAVCERAREILARQP